MEPQLSLLKLSAVGAKYVLQARFFSGLKNRVKGGVPVYILVWFHSNMTPTLTITHSDYFCCRSESSGAYASFID
jgi:hypothetical protein